MFENCKIIILGMARSGYEAAKRVFDSYFFINKYKALILLYFFVKFMSKILRTLFAIWYN